MSGTQATRSCGDCKACCITMPIREGGFRKPRGVLCKKWQNGSRCSIYRARPHACKDYFCLFMQGEFGDDERPDKVGVQIDFMDAPPEPVPMVARFFGLFEGALTSAYAESKMLELINRGVEMILLMDISGRKGVAFAPEFERTPERIAFLKKAGVTYMRRLHRIT